jgi:hypothetical protein
MLARLRSDSQNLSAAARVFAGSVAISSKQHAASSMCMCTLDPKKSTQTSFKYLAYLKRAMVALQWTQSGPSIFHHHQQQHQYQPGAFRCGHARCTGHSASVLPPPSLKTKSQEPGAAFRKRNNVKQKKNTGH